VKHMDQVVELALARQPAVDPPRPRRRGDDTAEPQTDQSAERE
jgi:hypothetical protein